MKICLSRKKHPFRRTVHTTKILGLVAMAALAASCNRDAPDEPHANDATSEVFVSNNSAELSKRVTLYGATSPSTRGGSTAGLYMPEPPPAENLPYDLLLDDSYRSWSAQAKSYCLPAGKRLETDLQFKNNVYYIGGELTLTAYWGQGKLVVLPGGKVTYPKALPVNGLEILNYGVFDVAGETFVINRGASFMTAGEFFSPALYVSGAFYAGTGLCAPQADVREDGVLHVGCGMSVERRLKLHNSASLHIGSYLSVPSIEMNSASLLRIEAGSLVRTGELLMKNPCTLSVEGADMDYAVVSADRIEINQSDVKNMFTGWLDLHFEKLDNRSGRELEWRAGVRLNGDTYLPAAGCHPSFGKQPATPPAKSVGIEHIAQIKSPSHLHDISSTCIQHADGKAYVSYHTRGTGYRGCIEVLHVADGRCSILSYLEHASVDFNHLVVDGSRILTACDSRKTGASLGIIGLHDGIFNSGAAEFTRVGLNGASANCVMRNGAFLHTATNEGFQTLDARSFDLLTSVPSAGSSKFIHADGTGIGVLSLSDNNTERSAAALDLYRTSDPRFESPVRRIGLGIVAPVNGKNVFRWDGDDLYVCLGANGVKRFRDGMPAAEFKLDDDRAAANGLAVDDKYLYVAYGRGGLFVLDKSDLSVVASYRHAGGKSANYVAVSENILYVAYGLSGVQIFRLLEK